MSWILKHHTASLPLGKCWFQDKHYRTKKLPGPQCKPMVEPGNMQQLQTHQQQLQFLTVQCSGKYSSLIHDKLVLNVV